MQFFGSVINMSIARWWSLLDYTHHEYRYTFTISGVLTIIAVCAPIVVHQKFMKYGGLEELRGSRNKASVLGLRGTWLDMVGSQNYYSGVLPCSPLHPEPAS